MQRLEDDGSRRRGVFDGIVLDIVLDRHAVHVDLGDRPHPHRIVVADVVDVEVHVDRRVRRFPEGLSTWRGFFTTQGSMGCAKTGAMTGVQQVSGMVGGTTRTSTVFVPTDYDPEKAYPIVFVFHGDGGTGASVRTSLDLEPDANGKAIFAYPDGLQETWDATEVGGSTTT